MVRNSPLSLLSLSFPFLEQESIFQQVDGLITRNFVFCFRSSHRRCSVRKDVLRNFTKFTGKHLYQSLFFNKVAAPRPAVLLKKRLWQRCFPVNFVKFLGTPFLQNTTDWLLLLFLRFALYFKGMQNSMGFYKGISLHVFHECNCRKHVFGSGTRS